MDPISNIPLAAVCIFGIASAYLFYAFMLDSENRHDTESKESAAFLMTVCLAISAAIPLIGVAPFVINQIDETMTNIILGLFFYSFIVLVAWFFMYVFPRAYAEEVWTGKQDYLNWATPFRDFLAELRWHCWFGGSKIKTEWAKHFAKSQLREIDIWKANGVNYGEIGGWIETRKRLWHLQSIIDSKDYAYRFQKDYLVKPWKFVIKFLLIPLFWPIFLVGGVLAGGFLWLLGVRLAEKLFMRERYKSKLVEDQVRELHDCGC